MAPVGPVGPVEVPPIDPAREQALLAAFDAHWSEPPAHDTQGAWQAAAALVAITMVINWLVAANPPLTDAGLIDPVTDEAAFVAWPGAEARPPFESGAVVQVDLPVSALPGLGLSVPHSTATVVPAEIIVGQDGFARAVRVIPSGTLQ
jgi:hypothetical protein